jgi:glycosyltransferase involved in cell wall biosynthesis
MLFLGSFPPRECGIATFMKDVVDSYDQAFATRSAVIAIDEPGGEDRVYPDRVVAHLVQRDRDSYYRTAEFVNSYPCDVLNIQHEYGLFGGDEGEWVVDLISAVAKPVVTSLHTVLPDPSPEHMRVARAICATSTAIVVLSETGREILIDRYDVDPAKIHVIHHGVPDVPLRDTLEAKKKLGLQNRTTISTFGLISRGKGLEYAIEGMQAVVESHPEALYLVLGQTHPVIRRNEGESYRRQLEASIAANGLTDNVKLVDKYLEFDEAVVSTPYLYAQELLAHGRGFTVPFRDSSAIATTLVALLDDAALREATQHRAYKFGRRMTWPHVSSAYGMLFTQLLPASRRAELATSA